MALRNPAAFFASIRKSGLLGSLDQSEVDGINVLLDAAARAKWPMSFTAYMLATAFHETAGTMQPISERGGNAYFTKMYDILGARPKKARELGNLTPGDGVKYRGRGYPQVTGLTNYEKASKVVGVDLVAQPDRLMEPAIAAAVTIDGMEKGWFTGRKLSDDLPLVGRATLGQFRLSRDVINGRDREVDIALEAMQFQNALIAGDWQ